MIRTELSVDPQVENLETSDLRFSTTFNNAAVGIAHVSEFGRFLRVNQKFCEIVGYKREELMTKTFQDITFPDDLQQDVEAAGTVMAGKIEAYTMEKRYIRKDGSIVWVSLTVSGVRQPGQTPYFISVITDINARKQGEEALHEAHLQVAREREFARMERDSFFNLAQDCMAATDLQGYFVRVNPAFCHLLGYTEVELTTRPARFFMHPDDIEATLKYRSSMLNGENKGDRFENRYLAKDGSSKWISWTGRNIPGVGNYITGRDITDLKAEEMAAKQRQIMMQTNLKLNAIGMMAANMAHEINNPLTIIFGEGCMLRKMVEQKSVDLQKLARIGDNVVKMSERIVSIVSGLRALARDGSMDPMKSVPLRGIFEETIPFCRGKITASGIQLNVELPHKDIYVCCRSVQLSQAILNLLNNAYDAIMAQETKGHIDIFTRLNDKRVEICVRDSGPGIPPEFRDKLFQPFATTKSHGKGLGLGLSVSRTMIESNHGELYLAETENHTTFVVSLPRVSAE